ncbi:choice-of-anchor Q domain-containing protein, partial [Thermodesulfobacteriota bacterium]
NINQDPLFLGGGDYHLLAGSPCIDAGADAGVYDDLDGLARPQGAGFDMGAYEYHTECWDDDEDGYEDGECGGVDCDDTDPEVNPGHPEVPDNGIDDDCDGQIDEGCFINLMFK